MASQNDRSRSPKAGADNGVAELDEKFVELWAEHVDPKMQGENIAFEGEIKKVGGSFVKTKVDRLENGCRV